MLSGGVISTQYWNISEHQNDEPFSMDPVKTWSLSSPCLVPNQAVVGDDYVELSNPLVSRRNHPCSFRIFHEIFSNTSSIPMTDPWCCYIWCAMDPINKNPSHFFAFFIIFLPAPAGSVMGYKLGISHDFMEPPMFKASSISHEITCFLHKLSPYLSY